MVCCCIYGCSNNSNKNKGVGFFLVPKIISWQCSKTYNLSSERRSLWLSRINRKNFSEKTIEGSRVCGAHFVSGKPTTLFDNTNVDWAPTIELGYKDDEELEYKRGRWVKSKKNNYKKTQNCQTKSNSASTSTSSLQSRDFIMLEGVDCDIDDFNLLKRKNKSSDDFNIAGSSKEGTDSAVKEMFGDMQETLKILLSDEPEIKPLDSKFKDGSCQTDIKCEYIGHLETHVVHLRGEVKNLKQQIEQYEAYYQMMTVNENRKNNTNEDAISNKRKWETDNDGNQESATQLKKHKPMLKSHKPYTLEEEDSSSHNNDVSEDEDIDYRSLFPQVVIKEEPYDDFDKGDMTEHDVKQERESEEEEERDGSDKEIDSKASRSYAKITKEKVQDESDEDYSKTLIRVVTKEENLPETNVEETQFQKLRKSSRQKRPPKSFDSMEMLLKTSNSEKEKPKLGFTAFTLWAKERREKIIKANPDMDLSDVSKFLSEMWKEVSRSEKYKWKRQASILTVEFKNKKNGFKNLQLNTLLKEDQVNGLGNQDKSDSDSETAVMYPLHSEKILNNGPSSDDDDPEDGSAVVSDDDEGKLVMAEDAVTCSFQPKVQVRPPQKVDKSLLYKYVDVDDEGNVIRRKKATRKDKGKSRFTAYLLWAREKRHEMLSTQPNLDFAAISKQLGEMWSVVPHDEKSIWQHNASQLSLAHRLKEARDLAAKHAASSLPDRS